VIDHLASAGDDRLIVEGIAFTGMISGGSWRGPVQGFSGPGGILRLTNCIVPGKVQGWFRGPDGQPAEMSNCWIGDLSGALQETTLRVTNSVLLSMFLDLPSENVSRLEIDGCVRQTRSRDMARSLDIPPFAPSGRTSTVRRGRRWRSA
jgi:hypothetical protein